MSNPIPNLNPSEEVKTAGKPTLTEKEKDAQLWYSAPQYEPESQPQPQKQQEQEPEIESEPEIKQTETEPQPEPEPEQPEMETKQAEKPFWNFSPEKKGNAEDGRFRLKKTSFFN